MPRIHYPKGIGTSRVRGPKWPGGCRIPRLVSPFITKAHETLTRRPGESCVSVPRVRRRPAHHRPNRSRRGGSHRSRASQVASSSESGSGDTVPEGLRLRGSSRGCFQRGTSMTKALPPRVSGRCQPPRACFDCRSVPVLPALLGAGLPRVCGSLNPGPTHLSGLFGDSMRPDTPHPTTSQACEGFRRSIPSPDIWVGWFSCPGPARPCSGFQLVLGPSADTPRLPRPLGPPRACRASQLTGYLIASG